MKLTSYRARNLANHNAKLKERTEEKLLEFLVDAPAGCSTIAKSLGLRFGSCMIHIDTLLGKRLINPITKGNRTLYALADYEESKRVPKATGNTVPPRTPTEFRELKRDPFAHMKLAMVTR